MCSARKRPRPDTLDNAELDRHLYADVAGTEHPPIAERPLSDWSQVHAELRRKGVTKRLLWLEYREAHPDGYGYSRYCELYVAWAGHLHPTMRLTHKAGEKCFVDYAGPTIGVSSTRIRVRTARPSCLSPPWGHRATSMPRPSGARSCPTGSTATSARLRFLAG